MFRIGAFSKICKVSTKTLRYYDEIGLLSPAFIDKENGFRYYTIDQVDKLHNILSYRQMGFSISEIYMLINEKEAHMDLLFSRERELCGEISQLQEKLFRLRQYINNTEHYSPTYQVVIKELPDIRVFCKRAVLSNFDDLFSESAEIHKLFVGRKEKFSVQQTNDIFTEFVRFLDRDYQEDNIYIEYCIPVSGNESAASGLVVSNLQGGTFASILHKGSCKNIKDTYGYLYEWINQNEYSPCGLARELYLGGITPRENDRNWVTEIQIPVKKKVGQ